MADYAGPTGWAGVSEFLGWAVVCIAGGFGIAMLLRQRRQHGWRRYAAAPAALAAVDAPYWLSLGAPMTAKVVFTTSLQIVGSLATVGTIAGFGYILWTERQRC